MWGKGLSFPSEKGMLRIFIALKKPSSSAGFEPTNVGSNGKHAIHYSTETTNITTELSTKITPQ
jgi:hypothetical protein